MKRRAFLLLLTVTAIAAGIAVVMLPRERWLEKEIRSALQAQGVERVELRVSAVGWREASITGIALRKHVTARVDRLTVRYSPPALLSGISAQWTLEGLQLTDTPVPLPPLFGAGTVAVQGEAVTVEGGLASSDNRAKVTFSLQYDEHDPARSRLAIHTLALPWNGGTIHAKDAAMPLAKGGEGAITIEVKKVPLDVLLGAATSQRAQATGTVSGSVPVTLRGDGTFVIRAGRLAADKPGTVTLSPDAIPGDNAQLGLLREVLGNFHYRALDMGIASDAGGKLALSLKLEGNNPNAYGGKPVKLNVHLTGDVLSFLTQSVMPMTDPKQWMEENNAKP